MRNRENEGTSRKSRTVDGSETGQFLRAPQRRGRSGGRGRQSSLESAGSSTAGARRRRPRVLLVVENLPVPFDRRVWLEATTLQAAGFDVSVICPTGKGHDARFEVLDGVHIYRHPLPPETGSKFDYVREYVAAIAWQFRLAERVRRERGFDVVHICNPPDILFLVAAFYRAVFRTRVIFDQHDLFPEMYESKFGGRDGFHRLVRLAESMTFRTAHTVIATNESSRTAAIERGRKAPRDVFIVRSAPDLDRFAPVEADPVYKGGRDHLVGYLGIMGEQDGVDRLVDVARMLVHDRGRKDIQFLLIGGGPAREALERDVKMSGLDDFMTFVGYRSGDELLRMLSTCDVCVCPDPPNPYNHACTMNKVLEYMALGKPLIQFDLREGRVSAGDAALYAESDSDFADKIERLVDDPEMRSRMGAIGRSRMERELAWEHQAGRLVEAYDHVLQDVPHLRARSRD